MPSFVEGVSWPVHRASLAALSDLGLTIVQIARYFSVGMAEVRAVLTSPLGARKGTQS